MFRIHLFACFSWLLCLACFYGVRRTKNKQIPALVIFLLFGAGLCLRIYLAIDQVGFSNDIACFTAWAERIYQLGPSGFYSTEILTDYPPLFMYVLYLLGYPRSFFEIEWLSSLHLLLIKSPAILADLACGYLIYREATKHIKQVQALCLTSAYLFLPAILLNSSSWGQVDAVHTLMIVLMCLFLTEGRMIPAYVVYGIGILLKPQMLIFTPVLLVGIIDEVFLKGFQGKKFFQNLFGGLSVIAGMVLLCLPFGLENVLNQYSNTLDSYPFASVNAANFWSLIGMNWIDQNTVFLFLPAKTWGFLVILLIVVFSFVIGRRFRNEPHRYFLLGAFIILTMFVFSVRMHERYLYPVLALLLFAYIKKPIPSLFKFYTGFAVLHYYNAAHVLRFYDPAVFDRFDPFTLLVSASMVVLFLLFLLSILRNRFSGGEDALLDTDSPPPTRFDSFVSDLTSPLPPIASKKKTPFTRIDLILLLVITLFYSIFALRDLGSTVAPTMTFNLSENDSISLQFPDDGVPSTLSYYIAPKHDRSFSLETRSAETEDWVSKDKISFEKVFTWQEISLPADARYLRLTLEDKDASLIEWVFKDAGGTVVRPVNASDYPPLFDEADLFPAAFTFRNSMYFDEIYHARTAYEFVNGLTTYETTHPPLGKILISIGVSLFGMNPFGWRIVGTVLGILMLPFFYLFGKRVTQNTPAAALACFLFAFDFMHFAQTRIATIDVYATFFLIAMYYFMHQYCTASFFDTDLKKTFVPLGLSGILMGFSFASKWSSVYAGAGLAILFFACLARRYREYLYAKNAPDESTGAISHDKILKTFLPHTKKTILFCIVFFVLIPFGIYLLSYIPFVGYNEDGLLQKMLLNQQKMFDYHSTLDATHPYSSSWYQWPLMIRPIWYYSRIVGDTLREGISAFGNPLVWWVGVPAFLYLVFLLLQRVRSRETASLSREEAYDASFLLVGYLATYLPWVLVSRITYIYHYFLCVPFVVLMIVLCLMQWKKRVSHRAFLITIGLYALFAFGLFFLFYPVLAGQPVEAEYVAKYLRWFPGWVLVSG